MVNLVNSVEGNPWRLVSVWGVFIAVYFFFAMTYVGRRTGTKYFTLWRMGIGNITMERTFAKEVKAFPLLNALYFVVKWLTPFVLILGVLFALRECL